MTPRPLFALFGLTCIAFGAGQAFAAQPLYVLAQSIPLGPGERWDYVTYDEGAARVYVAHGDHVTVVDANKGSVVGDIGTFPGGTHGIGIATGAGVGATDDGKAGTAEVFDLHSLKLVKQIAAAEDADGIVFDPASGHFFVINGDSKSISVIDPKTRSALTTIAVGSALEAGVADGKGKLFVDGVAQHDIIVIDTKTNAVVSHYPMAGCERPHGIAVDASARRVFATCVNKVMLVVDADNGANVATLAIGSGSDGAVFDPVRKRAISANGEGTLTIVEEKDADHFVSLGEVATMKSARTIAIDPKSGRLFLPGAETLPADPAAAHEQKSRARYKPRSLKLLVYAPAG